MLGSATTESARSFFLLPTTITAGPGPIARTLSVLAKRGLVEERDTSTPERVWRHDDVTRYGSFVTSVGLRNTCPDAVLPALPRTKAALVATLLSHPKGATLRELIADELAAAHHARVPDLAAQEGAHAGEDWRNRHGLPDQAM